MKKINYIEIDWARELIKVAQKQKPYIEGIVEYGVLNKATGSHFQEGQPSFQIDSGAALGNISTLCDELGLPLISAIVVNKYGDKMPSDGFLGLMVGLKKIKKVPSDEMKKIEIKILEINRVHAQKNWSKLENYLNGIPNTITTQKTNLEIIIESLKKLGGSANYSDIYREFDRIKGYPSSVGVRAGIRKTIEDYSSDSENFKGTDLFYSVDGLGNGKWGLRKHRSNFNDDEVALAKKEIQKKEKQEIETDANFVQQVNDAPEPQELVSYSPKQKAQVKNNVQLNIPRNPEVAKISLREAEYKCEFCGIEKLFLKNNGQYYVEASFNTYKT